MLTFCGWLKLFKGFDEVFVTLSLQCKFQMNEFFNQFKINFSKVSNQNMDGYAKIVYKNVLSA